MRKGVLFDNSLERRRTTAIVASDLLTGWGSGERGFVVDSVKSDHPGHAGRSAPVHTPGAEMANKIQQNRVQEFLTDCPSLYSRAPND